MLRSLSLVLLVLFLAACADTGKHIVKCGEGVYAVSGSPNHPYGNYLKTARNVGLDRASAFCESKGKQMSVENIEEGLPTHVKFRCLKEGDLAIKPSDYHYEPIRTRNDPCN